MPDLEAQAADAFIHTFQPILDGFYDNPPRLTHVPKRMLLIGEGGFVSSQAWPPWTRAPQLSIDGGHAFAEIYVRLRDAWDLSGNAVESVLQSTSMEAWA